MNKNPYKVLNLSDDSSYQEIKQRYLHLSKNIHPDKQPLQNYAMAKLHFQQIDKAYKSISSPLRRFIFREYGLSGISLIDQYPQQFFEFQNHRHEHQQQHVDLNDYKVQKKIRQLIEYMMHQRHAMHQIDKSKLNTRTVVNVSKLLKMRQSFEGSIRAPDLQKNSFSYQMPLPQFYGFSNSFGLSHQSSGFARQASTDLGFNISSMIRLRNTYLLHAQLQINKNQTNFDFHIDKIIGTSLQLRFNPISINSDGQIGIPKCGFDKSFQKFSVSGITDFYHLNFEISDNQKESKLTKSSKLMIQKNAIMVVPKFQYDFTDSLKFIGQTMITLAKDQDWPSLSVGYGYRYKISQQLKLQLLSFFGGQNYLQLTFFSPKYKVALPIVSEGNPFQIQFYKMSVMLGTYFAFQMYSFLAKRSEKLKKKTLEFQYDRLIQEKQAINRLINQANTKAKQSQQRQLKYNGLVVIKAFIGQNKIINKIKKILNNTKAQIGTNEQLFLKTKQQIQRQIEGQNIKWNDIQSQLYDITDVIQENVFGAQLIKVKLENLNICVYQSEKPHLIISYLQRGHLKTYHQFANKNISIGGLQQENYLFLRSIKLLANRLLG